MSTKPATPPPSTPAPSTPPASPTPGAAPSPRAATQQANVYTFTVFRKSDSPANPIPGTLVTVIAQDPNISAVNVLQQVFGADFNGVDGGTCIAQGAYTTMTGS